MCKYFIYVGALFFSLFLSGLFLSQSASADVDLYICKKNGETFLQDTKPVNCDTLKTFNYRSVKAPIPMNNESQRMDHYYDNNNDNNGNDSIYGSLWQQEQTDYYTNQCFFYDSKIKNEMLEIERRPEDSLEVRQIVAQIPKDKAQYQYYCGRAY